MRSPIPATTRLDAGATAARAEGCVVHSRLAAELPQLEPRLRAVALRYTRDPEHAADVLQSAFEKALRHAESFRQESLLSTWLHRIVVNEALMWLRARRRRGARFVSVGSCEQLAVADPAPSAPERLEGACDSTRLRHALDALPARDRQVLEQVTLGDASPAAYARAAGVSARTVRTRTFRARRRLAALLRERAS